MPAQPAGLKHPRPDCRIPGWAAAWAELDRIGNDEQRHALARLVRGSGFRGAPALKYAAQLARYLCGLTPEYPSAPGNLLPHESALVERRVRDELAPYADKQLFGFIKPL